MKKRRLLLGIVICIGILCVACISKASIEPTISYSSWLEGEWECVEIVSYCMHPLRKSIQVADRLVGQKYVFSDFVGEDTDGGVVPIRDANIQRFFYFSEYPLKLNETGLKGSYYAIVDLEMEELAWATCLYVKDEGEMLLSVLNTGLYLVRRTDTKEQTQNTYDSELSFEQNIQKRMEIQGIKHESYYRGVWNGDWTIDEVVCSDDMEHAREHIGENVIYEYESDSFDVQFIASPQDKIFYGMPTTGELGLDGPYYVLVWDAECEYPAAIVKNEHEMFLIKGNTLYRATQENEYYDDILLEGL